MAKALYLLAVLCSMISQIPAVLDSGGDQYLKAVWVLPFLYLLLSNPRSYLKNELLFFYFFVFIFAYYCFVCDMFTDGKYFTEDLYNTAVSLLMTTVSFNFWKNHSSNGVLQAICLIFAVSGTILAINVYINFLQGASVTSATYAFSDKNSVAQILLCCVTFVLIFSQSSTRLMLWVNRFLALIMLFILILLRSRATFVSGLVIIGYYIFKSGNKRARYWFFIILSLVVMYIASNTSASDIIYNGIIMGGRDASDVNDVSSGRVFLVMIAIAQIPEHLWVGIGDYYVDCMPINILLQYGVVGVIIVFTFLFYLFRILKKHHKTGKICSTAYIIYLSFLVNALFEARPPFGPGVRSFTLWMLVGFALAEICKSTKNKEISKQPILPTTKNS